MAVSPNSELGGLSPAELKFGTVDFHRFHLPASLSPGHSYHDIVAHLDENLATVRRITHEYQCALRTQRQRATPSSKQNMYQPGDLVLWNPKEHAHAFRTSKLAPKLLGPYTVLTQTNNNVTCLHCHHNTQHVLHTHRLAVFWRFLYSSNHRPT